MSAKYECNCRAYVDGAYSSKHPNLNAIGVIVITNHGKRYCYCGCIECEMLAQVNNIGSEIYAAWQAAHIASKLHADNLVIYHDYMGVSQWVEGHWAANTLATQVYVKEMKKFESSGMKITFRHVDAHSGNYWNDQVDRLAKYALHNKYHTVTRKGLQCL